MVVVIASAADSAIIYAERASGRACRSPPPPPPAPVIDFIQQLSHADRLPRDLPTCPGDEQQLQQRRRRWAEQRLVHWAAAARLVHWAASASANGMKRAGDELQCQRVMASMVILTAAACQVTALALIGLSALTNCWLLRNRQLSNTSTLKGDYYGLWRYCITEPAPAASPGEGQAECQYIQGFPEWWNASRSFITMSGIVSVMAIVAYFTTAFNLFPGERGRTTFIGATASFAESSFLVISLSIFVAKAEATYEAFSVGWSYYTAWAAFASNLGSLTCVLLFFFCRPPGEQKTGGHVRDPEGGYSALLPTLVTELPRAHSITHFPTANHSLPGLTAANQGRCGSLSTSHSRENVSANQIRAISSNHRPGSQPNGVLSHDPAQRTGYHIGLLQTTSFTKT